MTRSEFEESDGDNASQEAIREMTKHIKLLDDQIRFMSQTQVQMQKDMEALIKKSLKMASRPVLKATNKMLETNKVLE